MFGGMYTCIRSRLRDVNSFYIVEPYNVKMLNCISNIRSKSAMSTLHLKVSTRQRNAAVVNARIIN